MSELEDYNRNLIAAGTDTGNVNSRVQGWHNEETFSAGGSLRPRKESIDLRLIKSKKSISPVAEMPDESKNQLNSYSYLFLFLLSEVIGPHFVVDRSLFS